MEHLWHHEELRNVLSILQSSQHGLADAVVEERRRHAGKNALPVTPPPSAALLLLRQAQSSLVVVLLVAAVISFGLGDPIDAILIFAAVLLNMLFGFVQEYRAEHALRKLHQAVAFHAMVLRGGAERQIPAETLVPGDVVLLAAGDRVPADARLLQATDLYVHEGLLTGESVPVHKSTRPVAEKVVLADRTNMVYLGSLVLHGSGRAVVTAIGTATAVGAIAASLGGVERAVTPLQRQLHALAGFLSRVMLVSSLVVFVLGLLADQPFVQMLTVAVALAVAAIPEGLLVSVTVILALSTQRMLRHHALIRRLVAAETLGATSVICTDKTGTLTLGDMRVVRLLTDKHDLGFSRAVNGSLAEHVLETSSAMLALRIGMLCNDAHIEREARLAERRILGTPTEQALIAAAHAVGLQRADLLRQLPRLDTVPFDSTRKYMATLHREGDKHALLFVKGAPEYVLGLSAFFDDEGKERPLTEEKRARLDTLTAALYEEGVRLLAFAFCRLPAGVATFADVPVPLHLTFVGLMALQDPLRPEARATMKECAAAGITTVMMTGDHPITARQIARQLGLPAAAQNVLSGGALATMSDAALRQRLPATSVFARVSPEDKLRIVDAWQARSRVVAMTGDGVNDAPALRSADIGVALGSGTDVARDAADMVLLDNNFRTIVTAVREGRLLYENIRKVVLYLLADSFTAALLVGLSLVVSFFVPHFPLPLLTAQILWINLVTDTLPNIGLTLEPEEPELMRTPPRQPHTPLISKDMRVLIVLISCSSAAVIFGLFLLFLLQTGDVVLARSVSFAAVGLTAVCSILNVRTLRRSMFSMSLFANPWLVVCVLGSVLLQIVAVSWRPLQQLLGTTALPAGAWLLVGSSVLLVLLIIEAAKALFLRSSQRQQQRTARFVGAHR